MTWFFERIVEPHRKTFRMSVCFTAEDYQERRQYVLNRLLMARKMLKDGVIAAARDDGKEWQ